MFDRPYYDQILFDGGRREKEITEVFSLGESREEEKSFQRDYVDSLVIAEDHQLLPEKVLTESISFVENIVLGFKKIIGDNFSIIDSFFLTSGLKISDLFSLSEVRTDETLFQKSYFDNLALGETRKSIVSKNLIDSLNLLEDSIFSHIAKREIIDSFSLSESKSIEPGINLVDEFSFADQIDRFGISKLIRDELLLVDILKTSSVFRISEAESLNLSEVLYKSSGLYETDSISFSDSVLMARALEIIDSLAFTESPQKQIGKKMIDLLNLEEIFSSQISFIRQLTETESISESLQKIIGIKKEETLSLSDLYSRVLNIQRDFYEILSLDEVKTTLISFRRAFSEIVTIVEDSTKSIFASFLEALGLDETLKFGAEHKIDDSIDLLEIVRKDVGLITSDDLEIQESVLLSPHLYFEESFDIVEDFTKQYYLCKTETLLLEDSLDIFSEFYLSLVEDLVLEDLIQFHKIGSLMRKGIVTTTLGKTSIETIKDKTILKTKLGGTYLKSED